MRSEVEVGSDRDGMRTRWDQIEVGRGRGGIRSRWDEVEEAEVG